MSANLHIGDRQKAFLEIGIAHEDRAAFRFLFNINGREDHLLFARVPFGAEACPFILGATLNYHFDQYADIYEETTKELRDNTYVDNLMTTASSKEQLERFKLEATDILQEGKFPVHKWESNIKELEREGMQNPSKVLGHTWDKDNDPLKVEILKQAEDQVVTKKSILSKLGSVYDPLGLMSSTLVEGRRIYREVCEENNQWNAEASPHVKRDWLKWTNQLRNIKVPRSLIKTGKKVKAMHLHQFADASEIACSTVTIAIVEDETNRVMGLLTSKSRIAKKNTSIARLELIGGHMAANMVRNLCKAQ